MSEISRQARWAKAQREARGLMVRGRKRWVCPGCGGMVRTLRGDRVRRCPVCDPPKARGRPRKGAD